MKKLIALLMAAAMLLCLFAGCGGGTDASDSGSDSGDSSASAGSHEFPVADDFDAGPVWKVEDGEPNHDNGTWAQAYAVAAKLAEDAKAYDDVSASYTFTLACHDPAESGPGEFLTAWADAVTIATEGAVDFNIGFSGALSGTMASLDDMKTGTIDFDWTLPCYFKGYMPLTNVIQNPSLGIKNATAGSYAMWELYKSNVGNIQDEFADDGELLFVWTNCTSPLSYKGDHEVTSLSEVKGNIRANNGPAQLFVSQIGAEVFGCPIGDVYTNVSTGVINYLITDWHGISSFSFYDEGVLNYYIDDNIGCSAYCLMANSDVWASIPADVQEQIRSVSGDYLLNMVGIWDFWEAKGRFNASTTGDIYEPSEELQAELSEAYEAVAQTWISENGDDAQAVYDKALELVNQYNEQFDW